MMYAFEHPYVVLDTCLTELTDERSHIRFWDEPIVLCENA